MGTLSIPQTTSRYRMKVIETELALDKNMRVTEHASGGVCQDSRSSSQARRDGQLQRRRPGLTLPLPVAPAGMTLRRGEMSPGQQN
jgi:hypothetical protein